MNYWFIVLAVDKETIRGFYEGVVPMSYKPPSKTVWCMVKADTRERAMEMARESFIDDMVIGETLSVASIARLYYPEMVDD